jgi:ubiquinone/menaquinone biosynthesis C-methylase UbiE/uncharacterized protein YbaR (Trm112 family)
MDTPPVCDYEGSDYQTSFWKEGGRAYEDACEVIALKRLLPESGKLMLELGAGAGRNTPRYKGYEKIVLLDYSFTQLQQAKAQLGESEKYRYIAADAYKLPFVDGLFDGATMIRTLHHMADAKMALAQVRRVVQSGATFILEYANKRNMKSILRYLLKKQTWSPYSPEPVEFAALNFDFHPKTVKAWLSVNNFHLERQLTVSHFRVGWLKRAIPVKLLSELDSLLQLTGSWFQLSPSVFTSNRAIGESPEVQDGAFFRCPACGCQHLPDTPPELVCPDCGRKFPVIDGIYDFRMKDEE